MEHPEIDTKQSEYVEKGEQSLNKQLRQEQNRRIWKVVGVVILALFVLGSVFTFGLGVRSHRARSTLSWDSYDYGQARIEGGMMGMRTRGMMGEAGEGRMGGRSIISQDSQLLGAITKIDGNNLTVRANSKDQAVAVTTSTSFYKQGVIAKQSDLVVGDILTIIGNPDSAGVIQATSISIR